MSRPNLIDEAEHRHGRWLVLEQAENDKHGQARWLCQCDCGEQRIVLGGRLRDGTSKSCGCWNREVASSQRKGKPPATMLPKGEAAFNALLANMKRGARTRGYEWSLAREEVRTLTMDRIPTMASTGYEMMRAITLRMSFRAA